MARMDRPLTRCAPQGRGDLARMAAPELLGVALKEHRVELLAKAVDVKVFQRILGPLVRRRRQIAHARLHRGGQTHVADGVGVHAHGVIKELLVIVDARNAPAREHHLVAGFRVRPARLQRHVAPEDAVVHGGRALQGHELFPPVHHAVVLGEKAMAADVHAVAVVAHRAGDAAKCLRFFQHCHRILRAAAFEQLIGRRQAGGAGADDDHVLHPITPDTVWNSIYHPL